MNRNWNIINQHYQQLTQNTVVEMESPHHYQAAKEVVEDFCSNLNFDSAVELGCGTAPTLNNIKKMGKETLGVTLLHEPIKHQALRKDMHFSGLDTNSFDMVATRHVLEHSPMPLLLLKEMHRIARKYAIVVLPTPTERMINTWIDHYSVFDKTMWEKLFKVAKWKVLNYKIAKYLEYEKGRWDEEYRWLLQVST